MSEPFLFYFILLSAHLFCMDVFQGGLSEFVENDCCFILYYTFS